MTRWRLLQQRLVRTGAWRLLRTRDFGLLWLGELVSQIGDSLNKVALLWFVYQTSGSALGVSLVGVLQTIPPLAFGPLLGVYLDRLRKKPTMIVVNLVHGALVAAIPALHSLGWLSLGGLYVLVFVISAVASFYGPAMLTSVPLLTREADLAAGNALIQSTAIVGFLLGPIVGGVGVSLLGIANVLYVDAATFLFAVACTVFIHIPEPSNPAGIPRRVNEVVGDLREGFDYLFRRQVGILYLTLVAGFQNIGATAFLFILPAFVSKQFAGGSMWLGFFWSALGLGMLLASISISLLKSARGSSLVQLALLALALGGVSVGALAFIKMRAAAACLMVVIGWSAAAFNPVVISLLEGSTPAGLRGRVLTAFNSATMATAIGGITAFGWLADHVGNNATMVSIGVVLLLTALTLMLVARVQAARRLLDGSGSKSPS